ncbi:DUF397 domain-containing protein [Nocardia sp. NPDC050412]
MAPTRTAPKSPNHHVGVRDSKQPSGPALMFTSAEWSAFTAATTRGEFDR